jgi:hypothetical protein
MNSEVSSALHWLQRLRLLLGQLCSARRRTSPWALGNLAAGTAAGFVAMLVVGMTLALVLGELFGMAHARRGSGSEILYGGTMSLGSLSTLLVTGWYVAKLRAARKRRAPRLLELEATVGAEVDRFAASYPSVLASYFGGKEEMFNPQLVNAAIASLNLKSA